jgi:ABC-type nitrate/sulfonate/bicarbonate transport system substrate-binding protein
MLHTRHASALTWRAAFLAVLLAGAAGPPADAADQLHIGIASPTFTFTPLQVGIDQGFFGRAGLEVDRQTFAGAAKLQQAMVANAADIALSGSTDFVYLVKGAPELAVAAFVGPPMGLGIIVADPKIRQWSDLRGKRIGVSSPSALTGWLALEFAHAQGWGSDGVNLVTLGGIVSAQGAALITGQVDAIASDTALGYELADKKQGRLLTASAAYVHDFVTNVTFASKTLMHDRPEVLRRFLAAWYETVAYMRSHKPETVAGSMAITGLTRSVTERQYDDSIAMFSTDGHITPTQLQKVAHAVTDVGMIETLPDLAPFYTDQFLPAKSS